MAKAGKGGHVRGAAVPRVGGLLTLSAPSLTLVNGQSPQFSITVTNPQSLGGFTWFYQSINGVPYTRFVLPTDPFFTLGGQAVGPVVVTGNKVAMYCEFRDSRAELVGSSTVVTGTVP